MPVSIRREPRDIIYGFLAALGRNIGLIAAVLSLALGIGVAVTLLTAPRYISSATIELNQQTDQILDAAGTDQMAAGPELETFLQTQVDIINGREMAMRVARMQKLIAQDDFLTDMGVSPSEIGTLSSAERSELVISLLRENMHTYIPRKSQILTISFTSPSPSLAANMANSYADNAITANLDRKRAGTQYARDYLQQQLVEAKIRLEQSETRLNRYGRMAGIIAPGAADGTQNSSTASRSVTLSSLDQVNLQLNSATARRIAEEERWHAARDAPATDLTEARTSPAVQSLQREIAVIAGELAQARSRYLDEHPLVKAKSQQLGALTRQLDRIGSGLKSSLRRDYIAALKEEQQLRGQVEALKQDVLSEQDRSVSYNILAREAETNRVLYDALLQRYQELDAEAGLTTNNIQLIGQADIPLRPVSPRLWVNLAVSMLLGLVIAGCAVVLRHYLDDSVRSPSDVANKLGLDMLAIIPPLRSGETFPETLTNPAAAITEAFNSLRGALLMSATSGPVKSVLVTSALPGEGKTTSSAALGIALARLGKSVVIVDCDLRKPGLHSYFGKSNQAGVSSFLTQQHALVDIIETTNYPGLALITSGPTPPNPADLIAGPAMERLLAALEHQYDIVLIDAPPVMGFADAPALAALVEAVLIVIEADRPRKGSSKAAIRRLRAAHANILGGVLNKFDPKKTRFAKEDYTSNYSYSGNPAAA